MKHGIFRIAGPTGFSRLVIYHDKFTLFGEVFVAHRTPRESRYFVGDDWRVSHKKTGFRVLPDAHVGDRAIHKDYPTAEEAVEAAKYVLEYKGEDIVKEAVLSPGLVGEPRDS